MKYLVTGGSGKLGTELCQKIECLAPSRNELDILNLEQVEKFASQKDIDAILHLAAISDTKFAEQNREITRKVNVQGTINIVLAAQKFNKKIVYISTDYVFPCTNGGYKETDKPKPFNWYGVTKYEGELEIQKITDNYLIIRTSFRPAVWQFPTAYDDVYTSADYVDAIAGELALCLNKLPDLTGIIHIGTAKKTLYELAKKRNPSTLPEHSQDNRRRRDFDLKKWKKLRQGV